MTDKINQARGKFHRYQDLQADLKTNKAKLRQAQAELQKQQPLLQKLEHLQQLWPVYHEWQSSHQTRPLDDYLTDQQVTTAQELQVREGTSPPTTGLSTALGKDRSSVSTSN